MLSPFEKLQAYDLRDMIAPGGSSVVFSAMKKDHPLSADWRVAVKFVWHRGLAREEAQNLVNLDTHRGVVNLLDYFEIPFAEVERNFQLAARDLNPFETVLRETAEGLAGEQVGVLVLQFLAGSPLVRHTAPIDPESEDPDPKRFLLVQDLETENWFKQELSWDLSLRERIDILQQVTHHIAECHERQVVHADLKPQNILYEPENRRVTILDFGGSTALTRGSPGWQAPEHFKLAAGTLSEVPLKLDVFLLGLFINRLLQPFHIKAFRQLAEKCLSPLAKRPSAKEVAAEIGSIQRLLFKSKAERIGIPTLAALLVLSIAWGINLYLNRGGPSLRDQYGEDNGYSLVEDIEGLDPSKVLGPKTFRDHLNAVFADSEAWPELRENVSLAKALYFKKFLPEKTDRQVSAEEIRAIWHFPGEYYIKAELWLEVGDFIQADYYLRNVTLRLADNGFPIFDLHLVNFDGKTQLLSADQFPFFREPLEKGTVSLSSLHLEELVQFVANLLGKKIRFAGTEHTPARGTLHFSSKEALFEELRGCYESREDADGVLVFSEARQKEYFFSKFSLIRIQGERNLRDMVALITKEKGLTLKDEAKILQNKRTLRKVEAEKVEWQVFLNMLLEQHQLQSELRGNEVLIRPRNDKNR